MIKSVKVRHTISKVDARSRVLCSLACAKMQVQEGAAWLPYSGRSVDRFFSYVLVKRDQVNTNRTLCKCKIYTSVGSISNGPSNIRRHLIKHNADGSKVAYESYLENHEGNATIIRFLVGKYD